MNILVFIADGWGAKYGGINAFNKDLCLSIAKLKSTDEVICVTPDVDLNDLKEAKEKGVDLIITGNSCFKSADGIIEKIKDSRDNLENWWWIGHDVKTGFIAIECAKKTLGKSAVIHHMDYSSYYIHMSNDPNANMEKEDKQREVLSKADKIFAVGPKLKRSAEDIILGTKEDNQVIELIPGLADVEPLNKGLNKFSAITFGRVSDETNIIKQTKLAIAAFSNTYNKEQILFNHGAEMYVIGIEKDNIVHAQEELSKFALKYGERIITIKGIPYTENREELFTYLKRSSICMMLSLQEGFGLVGFEAISAGVPLIISKKSGLYEFLENKIGAIANGAVYGISILGNTDKNGFSNKDLENVSNAIKEIKVNYDTYKKNAIELRKKLFEEGYTWENTANNFLENLENLLENKQELKKNMLK